MAKRTNKKSTKTVDIIRESEKKVVGNPMKDKVAPVVEEVDKETVEEVIEPVEPEVKKSSTETVKERILKNQSQFGKEFFEKAECNYKAFGQWQNNYASMLETLFGIKNKNILDAGGAYGALGHAMAAIGGDVTVLDISKHVIDEKIFPNVKYVLAPIQAMKKIDDNSIDFVHASYVIEYVDVEDLERTFKEIKRVLKKDGLCFILTNCNKDGFDKESLFKQFEKAGLENVIGDYVEAIKKLPVDINFFKEYAWDVFLIKK